MKATIKSNIENFNPNFRKENHFREEFAAYAITPDGKPKEVAVLRIYQTDSRTYACAWFYAAGNYNSGSAQACGYGYHRASAAAGAALRRAGVELSEDIDGRGDSAIEAALEAVCRALLPDAIGVFIHHAHA